MKLTLSKHLLIVMATGIGYVLLFKANMYLFANFEISSSVNWVFLPSGLRLIFVLLFLFDGALGIALGSVALSYSLTQEQDMMFSIITGLISGFAPYIARKIAIDWLELDPELGNLDGKALFKLSVLFAVTSAVLHQIWFTWIGVTTDFAATTAIMAIGDWVGTVLVLYTSRLILKGVRRFTYLKSP